MDEVGQPGGALPGTNGAGRSGAGEAGGNDENAAYGFGAYRLRSEGVRPAERAEAAATIMPAWRAGVERAGVERIGAGGTSADAVAHAELLASLRVARANIERNGPGQSLAGRPHNGRAGVPHTALTEDTLESMPSEPHGTATSRQLDEPDDGYVGRHTPHEHVSLPSRMSRGAVPPSPTPSGQMPAMPTPSAPATPPVPAMPASAMPAGAMPVSAAPAPAALMHAAAMAVPTASPMPAAPWMIEPEAAAMAMPAAPMPAASAGMDPLDPLDPSVPVESVAALLPHRVPAPPDVPEVTPDDDEDDDGLAEVAPPAGLDGPELTRIASRLRHKQDSPAELPDELDVTAILAAVRLVPGVSDAQLRANPGGVHTLRLDLADGADPGRVSRQVARLLKERMGLAAEPRRTRSEMPAPIPNDASAMPVAGAVPAPRLTPMPGPPVPRTSPDAAHGAGRPPFPNRPTSLADLSAHTPSPRAPERADAPNGALSGYPARVVLDQVRVATLGTEATVEVRLAAGGVPSVGTATGPAVDGYLLRLAAQAAAGAIDGLMMTKDVNTAPVRCFIDHAGVVPFGSCVVAVVVVLVCGDGWVEQLVGSALVTGDPRQAIVRATLAAVNRRLESLLT